MSGGFLPKREALFGVEPWGAVTIRERVLQKKTGSPWEISVQGVVQVKGGLEHLLSAKPALIQTPPPRLLRVTRSAQQEVPGPLVHWKPICGEPEARVGCSLRGE